MFALLKSILFLMQKPDAIDVKGTLDCSALTMAVCRGFSQMVELLVGWGADVNAVDQMESTPALLATKVKWQPFNDFSHLKKVRVSCLPVYITDGIQG